MNSRVICSATVAGKQVRLYSDTLDDGTTKIVGYTAYGEEYGTWRIEGMEEQTTIVRPAIERIEDVLYADGWDDCLIGHGTIFHGSDGQKTVAIYDRTKMVERLAREMMDDHESIGARVFELESEEDFYAQADEYISFNVEGAFMQPGMPVFATIQAQPTVVDYKKIDDEEPF